MSITTNITSTTTSISIKFITKQTNDKSATVGDLGHFICGVEEPPSLYFVLNCIAGIFLGSVDN